MTAAPLHGQRVLVTGASSGIGQATARAFLQRGAYVVATGRRIEPMLRIASSAEQDRLLAVPGDLRDTAFVDELVRKTGAVDVLVNSAGVLKHGPFLEFDPSDWEEAFQINVVSLLRLTRLVALAMAARKRGHIINISSTRADEVAPMTTIYSATKFALRAISKGLRAELRPFGIRVTEVAPGFTDSNLRRDVTNPHALAALVNRGFTPLTVQDVARAVVHAAEAGPNCSTDLLVLRPVGQE